MATDDSSSPRDLVGFPSRLARFVGRTTLLRRSARALSEQASSVGLLLHRAPGFGKSAAALELLWGHRDAFEGFV